MNPIFVFQKNTDMSEAKKLTVKRIEAENSVSLAEADYLLETQTISNSIEIINWESFPYLPKLKFRIGHIGNEIWLKYYVN